MSRHECPRPRLQNIDNAVMELEDSRGWWIFLVSSIISEPTRGRPDRAERYPDGQRWGGHFVS